MKKKIYFTILVATGVLGYSFSLNNVAFASLVCDSSSNYCTSVWKEKGYPDINACKQEQASCLSGLPGQCISAYGPNAVVVGGGSEKENTIKSCGCQSGYVGDNNGYCRTPDEITKIAQCHPYGSYSRGVCTCQDSYQLVNEQCIAQTVLDAQRKAKEDARNTQATPQCVAIRGENAEYKNFQCGCKEGYQTYIGNKCQTAMEACQIWYGGASISTTENTTTCVCGEGYVLSDKRCIPLAQPVSITPATVSPPVPSVALPPPTPVAVTPKPLITTPIKKKPQPSTESEVKTPPLSEITASTTTPQQITERQTEAREIIRPAPPVPIVKQENVFQRVWKRFLSWF